MFSFDKYKKRYLLQFFLDIGLTCLAVGWIVFCRLKQFNTEYIFWVLGSLVVLGLFRLAVLINWLIKAIAIRNVRLSLFFRISFDCFGCLPLVGVISWDDF